jgi:hypothetical protein
MCRNSEKIGPITAQPRMIAIANTKAHFDPSHEDAQAANVPNASKFVFPVGVIIYLELAT